MFKNDEHSDKVTNDLYQVFLKHKDKPLEKSYQEFTEELENNQNLRESLADYVLKNPLFMEYVFISMGGYSAFSANEKTQSKGPTKKGLIAVIGVGAVMVGYNIYLAFME